MSNFQREGSISNAHVGRNFEGLAMKVLAKLGIKTEPDFAIPIGVSSQKKYHKFDLGSKCSKVIVECKSHRWTKGNNVPSAKMTVWNEAMYYFAIAPSGYRKIFFVLKDRRASNGETLAEYYCRTYQHLIPSDVEIWEYDVEAKQLAITKPIGFDERK
jgi:hypothetical protein